MCARIPNDQILRLESHLSVILFQGSICYPVTGRKFCMVSVTNYWRHKLFICSQYNDGYPGNGGKYLAEVLKKYTLRYSLFGTFDLGHWKLHFLSITLHMWSVTIDVCGWCQAISSKIKMSHYFHCTFLICLPVEYIMYDCTAMDTLVILLKSNVQG